MKAQLDYSITVNCPNCGQTVELHTDSYYTEQIDNKVFNNKWDDGSLYEVQPFIYG